MSKTAKPHLRIGISGWRYAPWRDVFYPDKLPQRQELAFASRALPTIEVNGSFYGLLRPDDYRQWHEETPPGFVFSVKGSRYITHRKRLKNAETALANFMASGVLALQEKLGPFLWQLPPNFRFDPARLDTFLGLLPRDTAALARLASGHDDFMAERSVVTADRNRPVRHALEIRHDSFKDPAFVALLRKHNVALVVADTAGKWPLVEDVTADFMYLRLHGDKELYASGYSDEALDQWAARIKAWADGGRPGDARLIDPDTSPPRQPRDIYCYFDNDIKVHAPFDAAHLLQRLGLPSGLGAQGRFEVPLNE